MLVNTFPEFSTYGEVRNKKYIIKKRVIRLKIGKKCLKVFIRQEKK